MNVTTATWSSEAVRDRVIPPPLSRVQQIAADLARKHSVRFEASESIAAKLDARLWISPTTGQTVVLDVTGQANPEMNVFDVLAELRAAEPHAFAGGPTTAPKPAPTTLTGKAIAERDARKASTKTEAEAVNPYAAATRNLTRQAVMERDDPARAARLRSEAGA